MRHLTALPPASAVAALILGVSLIASGTTAFAMDAEKMVGRIQRHEDWQSFSMVNPLYGFLMMTRATTTDKRTRATLAFSYLLSKQCSLMDPELILESSDSKAVIDSTKEYGVIQFDNQPPKTVAATMMKESNSNSIYFEMDDKSLEHGVVSSRSVIVNYRGYGVITFSLTGASAAIKRAKAECEGFM